MTLTISNLPAEQRTKTQELMIILDQLAQQEETRNTTANTIKLFSAMSPLLSRDQRILYKPKVIEVQKAYYNQVKEYLDTNDILLTKICEYTAMYSFVPKELCDKMRSVVRNTSQEKIVALRLSLKNNS